MPSGGEDDADGVLAWKVSLTADHNWTVISSPAATVSEDRKTWLKDPSRSRSAENAAIKTTYPLAKEEGPHDTCLASLADAATVAGWWLALYGTQRYLVTVESKLQPMSVELGNVVSVESERFSLPAGTLGTVLKIEESYGDQARMRLGVMV
jgi:hypothetical protein